MKKKVYRVHDNISGADYDVEEKNPEIVDEDIDNPEIQDDEAALSPEDIAALKSLAAHASELIALISENKTTDSEEEKKEDVVDSDEDKKEEEIKDADEDENEDKEKVVDTKAIDSVGSVEKKANISDSSSEDRQIEIANAYMARFKAQREKGE